MERGVDSLIYKQEGRFFDMKKASLRCNRTPSSYRRNAPFELKKLFSNWHPLGTPPLRGGWVGLFHSERGRGRGCRWNWAEAVVDF